MDIETTYSQAREQLKALMDRAVDDREVIVVHRRSGDAVAMIAADELESLLETAHLLRSSRNAERLPYFGQLHLQLFFADVQGIARQIGLWRWRCDILGLHQGCSQE